MAVHIHGHTTEGDPEGLRYLESLSSGEVQTLYDEARNHGKAKFKYNSRHFELVRTAAGTYIVTRIQSSSSFF